MAPMQPPGTPPRGIVKPSRRYVNLPQKDGDTYLHLLCRADADPALVAEAVRDLGADIHRRNNAGMTPLAVALSAARAETVRLLLDHGAEIAYTLPAENTLPARRFNATYIAAGRGRLDILDLVLDRGGDLLVNKPGLLLHGGAPHGLYPLHAAAMSGHRDVIRRLIQKGAFIDQLSDITQESALHLAAGAGYVQCIHALLTAGADADRRNIRNETPLHKAAAANRQQSIRLLAAHGADIEARDNQGHTPLLKAASAPSPKSAETLLKLGANPDARYKTKENETPLMRAGLLGNIEMTEIFLRHRADPLLADAFNRTAADYARASRNNRLVMDLQNNSRALQPMDMLEKAEQRATDAFFDKARRKPKP